MMQIETIIINTSLIHLTEKSIPENFLKSNTNSTSSCNDSQLNPTARRNVKGTFNGTTAAEEFQPLNKAAKFPSYFNAIDLLKANSKK